MLRSDHVAQVRGSSHATLPPRHTGGSSGAVRQGKQRSASAPPRPRTLGLCPCVPVCRPASVSPPASFSLPASLLPSAPAQLLPAIMSHPSRRDSAITKARSLFRPRSRSKSRNGSVASTTDGSTGHSSTPASHDPPAPGQTLPGIPSLKLSLGAPGSSLFASNLAPAPPHPSSAEPESAPAARTRAIPNAAHYPARRTSFSLPFDKPFHKSSRASVHGGLSSSVDSSAGLSRELDAAFFTPQSAASSATDLRRPMPASGGARSHPPVSSSAFLAQNNNPSAMDAARKGIRRKFKAPTVLNIVLAGAKGMGKSTFAKTFLETCDLSLCDEAVRRGTSLPCNRESSCAAHTNRTALLLRLSKILPNFAWRSMPRS